MGQVRYKCQPLPGNTSCIARTTKGAPGRPRDVRQAVPHLRPPSESIYGELDLCGPRMSASNSYQEPLQAVDCLMWTTWNAGSWPPQWLIIDLGTLCAISEIKM